MARSRACYANGAEEHSTSQVNIDRDPGEEIDCTDLVRTTTANIAENYTYFQVFAPERTR